MSEGPVGIEFLEVMSGGFALGATDPELGALQGTLKGTSYTNHNQIVIPNLDRFLDNPNHASALQVTLDFTPFGDGIVAEPGVFNLFKPSPDEDVKMMVYRYGFTHEGEEYYFEGKKYIHDGSSIIKLFYETTHLYSRLYRGTDTSGEVAGAGVLSIGVRGAIDLVKSMKVLNASSKAEELEALAKFGKFFFGELWDSYQSFLAV